MARFFCIFHALSFEVNFFIDRRFPLTLNRLGILQIGITRAGQILPPSVISV